MQSLYKVIKSVETSGSEIISPPIMKKLQENLVLDNDNSPKDIYNSIIQEAKEKSEQIIREAQKKAENIVRDATLKTKEIVNASKEEGYQDGYKLGYQEGYNFGINEANDEAQKIINNATAYLGSTQTAVDEYIKNKRDEIIHLSLSIARQIICSDVMINPETVSKIAEKVLSRAKDRRHVILKVNPSDFNTLKCKKEDLSIFVESPNDLFIIADSSVSQGSIKAETPSGFIDGDIETQLQIIEKKLLKG